MGLFDRFNANVGRDVGANRLFVTTDGFFNVGDIDGGANGTDIDGAKLRRILLSPYTKLSYTLASAIQTVSVIPNSYGMVTMVYPSATTSCKLPVANPGAMLLLNFYLVASGQISIYPGSNAAGSVQSMVYGLSDLSCIAYSGILISNTWLELICAVANEWAVASYSSATNINLIRSS